MTRRTKIITFSLIAGGLLMASCCGGIIFYGMKAFQEFPKVIAASDGFLNLLNTNQVEDAYKATTLEFRNKIDLEQFQALVAKYPAFTKQTTRSMSGLRVNSTGQGIRAYVQYNLSNPNNTLSLNLILKDENGLWKVERINLP